MGESNELKVAVTAWNLDTDEAGTHLAEQGEIAEELGFDAFWLPESHFTGSTSIPSPLMLLATVAARTSRIRLGSTSYLLPIRHPIQAAEEVAVLDQLSGGRVILGVGRGFRNSMFTAFDVDVKAKRKQFGINLDTMISAWRGEAVATDEDGNPIRLAPLPVQKPFPPVWVAAFGPLAIKQAGSLGLPYIASPMETLQTLIRNYEQHTRHVTDAGHEPVHTVPVMRTLLVTENRSLIRQTKDLLKNEASHRMPGEDTDIDDRVIVGEPSYVRDRIAAYREELGMNYLIARGRISGVSDREQIASHERLAGIAG